MIFATSSASESIWMVVMHFLIFFEILSHNLLFFPFSFQDWLPWRSSRWDDWVDIGLCELQRVRHNVPRRAAVAVLDADSSIFCTRSRQCEGSHLNRALVDHRVNNTSTSSKNRIVCFQPFFFFFCALEVMEEANELDGNIIECLAYFCLESSGVEPENKRVKFDRPEETKQQNKHRPLSFFAHKSSFLSFFLLSLNVNSCDRNSGIKSFDKLYDWTFHHKVKHSTRRNNPDFLRRCNKPI